MHDCPYSSWSVQEPRQLLSPWVTSCIGVIIGFLGIIDEKMEATIVYWEIYTDYI